MASSKTATAAARAEELRDLLNQALIAYHVEDEPIMEDAAYDALYDELVALEEEHPELVTPDSPTRRVGGLSDKFEKVQHLEPMGSLEKVTTDEGLRKWDEDVRKRLRTGEPVAYVLEPKIDGLAVNLTYENGVLVRGATRRPRSGGSAPASASCRLGARSAPGTRRAAGTPRPAPRADGLARQGHDGGGRRQVGGRRAEAARVG